jgi:rhodanese-related sulfurtransferase
MDFLSLPLEWVPCPGWVARMVRERRPHRGSAFAMRNPITRTTITQPEQGTFTNLDYRPPGFQEQVSKLEKQKTYLVHCACRTRSAHACTVMDKLAFANMVNLEPGFRASQKAREPVER